MSSINSTVFIIHNGKYGFQKEWMKYVCKQDNIGDPIFFDKALDIDAITRLKKWGWTESIEKVINNPSIEDNLQWINVFLQINEYLIEESTKNDELDDPRFRNKNILILTSNIYLFRDFNKRINELIRIPISFDLFNLCTDNIFGPYMWSGNGNIRIFKAIKTFEIGRNENRFAWLTNSIGLSKILDFWKEKKNLRLLSEYSVFYILQHYYDRLQVYSIPKYLLCYPRS